MSTPLHCVKTDAGWTNDVRYRISLEPAGRRVRGELAGETVVDSLDAMLMLEQDHVPVWYFPLTDVALDLLVPTTHATHCPHKGEARYWTLELDDRQVENAAWGYPQPMAHLSPLQERLAFYWNALDRWLEEDEEVFVHPRDPRKRIDVVAGRRRVEVRLGEIKIADTRRALMLFETDLPTRYYIPPEDVRTDLLEPSATRTRCPYKGAAVYWSARVDGRLHEDLVWSYPQPIPECPRIAGLMAFFNERVDEIRVEDVAEPDVETRWSR